MSANNFHARASYFRLTSHFRLTCENLFIGEALVLNIALEHEWPTFRGKPGQLLGLQGETVHSEIRQQKCVKARLH